MVTGNRTFGLTVYPLKPMCLAMLTTGRDLFGPVDGLLSVAAPLAMAVLSALTAAHSATLTKLADMQSSKGAPQLETVCHLKEIS